MQWFKNGFEFTIVPIANVKYVISYVSLCCYYSILYIAAFVSVCDFYTFDFCVQNRCIGLVDISIILHSHEFTLSVCMSEYSLFTYYTYISSINNIRKYSVRFQKKYDWYNTMLVYYISLEIEWKALDISTCKIAYMNEFCLHLAIFTIMNARRWRE